MMTRMMNSAGNEWTELVSGASRREGEGMDCCKIRGTGRLSVALRGASEGRL